MRNARMGRGGFALLVFVAVASLGTAAHPQNVTNAERDNRAEIQQGTTRIADAIRDIRPEKDQGCQNGKDDSTSNLCAQWKAADAARRAASATWAAVLFSFIGTLLVAVTFWEQRKVSRAQLRPYLFVERIDVEPQGSRFFSVTIWFKNFGRTPARNIRAQIKTYGTDCIDDLRDFGDDDYLALNVAAPDHQRRAMWHLVFKEEEWANPSWACFGILRVDYTYTDDSGGIFREASDYFTTQADLEAGVEPVFFLLTDWTRQRHAAYRAKEPDLFSTETIEGIRERNLAAQREEREKQQAEIRKQMERLNKPSRRKPKRKPRPTVKPTLPPKDDPEEA